ETGRRFEPSRVVDPIADCQLFGPMILPRGEGQEDHETGEGVSPSAVLLAGYRPTGLGDPSKYGDEN
ncbi:MAG: hypothetical protein ABIF01_00010, partial [Candidatus Micrarchaeota archaeon]